MPEISLIVSTLGRTRELERLLSSLRDQTFGNFDITIVDQNADDRLVPVLAQYRDTLTLVHTRSARGLSLGRNKGLSLARGDIVAFPDDDCWYPKGLLERIAEIFQESPALDLVSGRTVDADFHPSLGVFHTSSQAIRRSNVWRAGNSNTIFVRAGANSEVRFDETLGVGANTIFQSGEETDLLLRLLHSGASLQYDRDIVVHHDQIDLRDAAAGLRRARAYAPGQGRVLRLHRFRRAQVLWCVVRPLARAGLAALVGDMALARYKMAWVNGLLSGYLAKGPTTLANKT